MKIKINQTHEDHNKVIVKFYSTNGNGIAFWNGTAPNIGDTPDVEMDIDEVLCWHKNIIPSPPKTPLITFSKNTTQIIARLIHDLDNDHAVLKLGQAIILIDIEEQHPQQSDFVQVTTTKLHLYPTNT
ncbi:hypothetical protein KUA23_12140 [Pseudomonas pergaminensis]|uniref:Uncharacterized protein n=1 Tax=Pseudomonas pergaminensis TaxID=2853159 RepID=A0ABD7TP24_9PSED|nr:hypothetical protein [Pseudomonas pergaminensis]USW03393.1 hypothetical protein KUA23_12140 [Pseudomonas pergaminensis]